MDTERVTRVAIWTASLAVVGFFLGMGKGLLSLEKLVSVLEGAIGGGLVGFGFGIIFLRPRNRLERVLRIAYATLPFGILGTLVGKALGIEDAPVGSDPGMRSTIIGAVWGIVVGIAVGLIVYLTSRVPASDAPGTVSRSISAE